MFNIKLTDMKTETKPEMKAEEAKRALAEKWGYEAIFLQGTPMLKSWNFTPDAMLSNINVLINEYYVPQEWHEIISDAADKLLAERNELLKQRGELKEALILAKGLIDMALDEEWSKIEAAIKSTEQ